jgi:hypothetical protein
MFDLASVGSRRSEEGTQALHREQCCSTFRCSISPCNQARNLRPGPGLLYPWGTKATLSFMQSCALGARSAAALALQISMASPCFTVGNLTQVVGVMACMRGIARLLEARQRSCHTPLIHVSAAQAPECATLRWRNITRFMSRST